MDMIRGDMIRGLVGQETCPSIGHDSWLGDKAQGAIVTVVEQAGHLKKWKRSSCGVWAFWARLTSLLKESVWRRQQVVVEKIAIACRLQLFVSLCGGIMKPNGSPSYALGETVGGHSAQQRFELKVRVYCQCPPSPFCLVP